MQGEENSEDENALLFRFLCLTFHKKHERLECISQGLSGRRQKKTKNKKPRSLLHSQWWLNLRHLKTGLGRISLPCNFEGKEWSPLIFI